MQTVQNIDIFALSYPVIDCNHTHLLSDLNEPLLLASLDIAIIILP